MRVLLQRVSRASVTVDGEVTGAIERGYALLVGVGDSDTDAQAAKLADKIVGLRLFPDDAGKFDRSLLDVGGGALVVSQFTLFADCRKGRRPSFVHAARPEVAQPLCDRFAEMLADRSVAPVATGRFGAHMDVELVNDGPVTIWLDTDAL
jgi:D-tyrosyl-tRNA(Tyr) deacylase